MKIRLLPCLLIVLSCCCFACSSSDDASEPAEPSSELSRNEVEDAAQYSLASMNENAEESQDIRKLYDVGENLGLDEDSSETSARTGQGYAPTGTTSLPCGSLTFDQGAFTMMFDGTCNNLTGTIDYTSSGGIGNRSYDLEISEVSDGECTIDGSTEVQMAAAADLISWTFTLDQMSICGRQYDGTVTLTLDPETGEVTYALVSRNYSYAGSIGVETDIDYSETDGISGEATVTINGVSYACIASGIKIDQTCGVPVSGTLTIQGQGGGTAVLDFSDTSCENKTVLYTLNGESHTFDLGETAAMIVQTQ
ncbi:MAG: hypothetical protein ACOZF0_10170 [Thermodesulfobacteriota bacterium]